MTDKPMKCLRRYEARTLGGGNNYRLEPEEDGPLCSTYDVEKLETAVRACEVLMEAEGHIRFHRTDGGENKIGVAFANLRHVMPAALEAMEEA